MRKVKRCTISCRGRGSITIESSQYCVIEERRREVGEEGGRGKGEGERGKGKGEGRREDGGWRREKKKGEGSEC